MLTKAELIAFEKDIEEAYIAGKIRGPIHLSGGNEDQLIEIFKKIKPLDWVFSTHRSHYHALLHGVPADQVKAEILAGRSINLNFASHRFVTSAIVSGCMPIALGVAMSIKMMKQQYQVWAFVGDMAAQMGVFYECCKYARNMALPLNVVIENNGLSVNTPTAECWGTTSFHTPAGQRLHYKYERVWPHIGCGKWVIFS